LHSRPEGCTWHRDFKPANILLDERLQAYLGDTGFAKATQRSGDRSGATTTVFGGAGSLGYCEDALRPPDAQTEGFAVGVTLLVVLTAQDPVDIEEACEEACGENMEFDTIPAQLLAQPGADWPASVADELRQLYSKLTHKRRNKRASLPQAMEALTAILRLNGQPCVATQPSAPQPSASATGSSPVYTPPGSAFAPPSQLSQQVRRLRPAGASLRQNVAEGFDSLMYQLEELYSDSDAEAPPRGEFEERLRHWHQASAGP
jgi:interleukin-1 receptor-associated kinase 1